MSLSCQRGRKATCQIGGRVLLSTTCSCACKQSRQQNNAHKIANADSVNTANILAPSVEAAPLHLHHREQNHSAVWPAHLNSCTEGIALGPIISRSRAVGAKRVVSRRVKHHSTQCVDLPADSHSSAGTPEVQKTAQDVKVCGMICALSSIYSAAILERASPFCEPAPYVLHPFSSVPSSHRSDRMANVESVMCCT